jgi:3-dehydroquinate synthase
MKTIPVKLFAGRGYFIKVGVSLAGLGREARSFGFTKPVLVVSDPRVAPRHAAPLLAGLRRAGFRPTLALIRGGEPAKTLDTVRALYRDALRARLDRRSAVVALGGGVVGDAAGFLAATFLRGVPFVQCPTTLLALVDSSVGGKVGVDLPEGKNLVGAFWQPKVVWADLSVLRTLPDREWRTGMAEVIKYGFIADPDLLARLEKEDLAGLKARPALWESLVARCAAIKAAVVSVDEKDTLGRRELLNLGHTFGHAVESVTRYGAYTHGEAISVGMCAAARLAARLKLFPFAYVRRTEDLLARWGLPVRAERRLPRAALLKAMSRDKKAVGGKFRFVVPVRWGRATSVSGTPPAVVSRVLAEVGL